MNFKKRGQSALEYLMTYGWALVVIVIAVAALVVLINPSTIQGDQCDAKLGPFTISQSSVTPNQTQLVLVNQTGQAVSFTNDNITVSGTNNGAAGYTETVVPSFLVGGTQLAANATDTLVINTSSDPIGGTYSLTYNLQYDAGQLTDINATGNCRGTI